MNRHIVWFSCGAASAVAASFALSKYGESTKIVYCDTSKSEHRDNGRFLQDVERWLNIKVVRISQLKYERVEQVFSEHRYMSGPQGARCTVEMKKIPRFEFQQADDIHIFGFTVDENKRISNFEQNNPELICSWILRDWGITKKMCYEILNNVGIDLPMMYKLGYKNNNCIGCVKATSPAYWAKIKHDFPDVFESRARQSREIGCRLTRIKGKRIFLDELPEGNFGRYKTEDISCGPECGASHDNG